MVIPAYVENYERIAVDHLEHYRRTGENPWIPEDLWVRWEDATVALIERFAPHGPMLDCGVGMGRLLSRFPDRERYGVDIASAYLPEAEKHGITVSLAYLEKLPFDAGRFGTVTCTDVLEHVLDPDPCVAEMLRVLWPTGYLFVRTPYKEDISAYSPANGFPYEYGHLRSCDEDFHRELFERHGGEVVEWALTDGEINVVVRK